MKIYSTQEGVNEYTAMCEGYDNSQFRDTILKYLPKGQSLLEVGMGPCNDYAWLSKIYNVIGSDYYPLFIDNAKKMFPKGKFTQLDGISLNINQQFNAVYSCKVYQHFELPDIKISLENQSSLLTDSGIIIHSFWIGDFVFEKGDMRAIYHNKEKLIKLISKKFDILEAVEYKEFEINDSVFILAKKKE